jgi:hypothetical protein
VDEAGRLTDGCRLLERVCQPDQGWLAVRPPEETDADRSLEGVAGRHSDDRVAGEGSRAGTRRSQIVIPVDQVNHPRWPLRRRHKRVEPVRLHHGVDSLLTGEAVILGQGIEVDRIRQRSSFLSAKEVLLTEIAKLFRGVLLVEPNQVLEAADR